MNISGRVYSSTVIRVPGARQEGEAPFVVLLVEREDGTRLLGRYTDGESPSIGSPVVERERRDGVPIFAPVKEEGRGKNAVETHHAR